MLEANAVHPDEASDLRKRVFRLEEAHAEIKERVVKHANDSRDSFARVHDRIDELKSDVTLTGVKLDTSMNTLAGIAAQVEPLTEIQLMLKGLRRFIHWIGVILTSIVAVYEFVSYLRHLPH